MNYTVDFLDDGDGIIGSQDFLAEDISDLLVQVSRFLADDPNIRDQTVNISTESI